MPNATVSGVQTVTLQNVNGTSGSAATSEVATVQFQALAAGQTVTIAGVTFTAGSSGATAVNVADAFTTSTITTSSAAVTGGALSVGGSNANADTRAKVNAALLDNGFVASDAVNTNSAIFTASTTGPASDLQVTGTAQTGRSQVVTMAMTTAATATMSITINGISVSAANDATTGNIKGDSDSLAAAINAYIGYTAAVVAAPDALIVVRPAAVILPVVKLVAALIANVDTVVGNVILDRVLTFPDAAAWAPPDEFTVIEVIVAPVIVAIPDVLPPVTLRAPEVALAL